MTTAYLRVSTDKQDAEGQRAELAALALSDGHTITTWIQDSASGGIAWQERGLGTWLQTAQPGARLYVTEFSRIARSLVGVFSFLERAAVAGVQVRIARPDVIMDDSLQAQTLAFAFGIAAQIERDLLRSRTKAALASRRAAGVTLGRPVGSVGRSKLDKHAEAIHRMFASRCSMAAIGRTFGASRQTVSLWLDRNPPTSDQERN